MPKKGDVNNPTGRGGFADNPENRASGRWRKEDSIPYWQNYFLTLEYSVFMKWESGNELKTVAQKIAHASVKEALKDLPYLKEVTDRTSGKAQQYTDITSGGEAIQVVIKEYKADADS